MHLMSKLDSWMDRVVPHSEHVYSAKSLPEIRPESNTLELETDPNPKY